MGNDQILAVFGGDVTESENNRKAMSGAYVATYCSFDRMGGALKKLLGIEEYATITGVISSVNGLTVEYLTPSYGGGGTRRLEWYKLRSLLEKMCVLNEGVRVIGVRSANNDKGVAIVLSS